MKVLITSGGTKIPIDKVRSITNMSNGTLGAKLAFDALRDDDEVFFLRAEKSKSPMQGTIDLGHMTIPEGKKIFEEIADRRMRFGHLFYDFTYKTFEEYQDKLQKMIAFVNPDVIILAAAVSDYAPETVVDGKIRTGNDLNIALKPLPKVISSVREWAGEKAFIVGFKLLVGCSVGELIDAAKDSIKKNKLDLVCANDLLPLLKGQHHLYVVKPDGKFEDSVPSELWGKIVHLKAGKENS